MPTRSAFEYQQILNNYPVVRKFLSLISWSEGASYNTLEGGGTFNDYSTHPANRGINGDTTTASGAFQIVKGTWNRVARSLGLSQFTPQNQDIAAAAILDSTGGLQPLIDKGADGFSDALKAAGTQWAGVANSSLAKQYGQGSKSLSSTLKTWGELLSGQKPSSAGDNVSFNPNVTTGNGIGFDFSSWNPFSYFTEPLPEDADQKFKQFYKQGVVSNSTRYHIAVIIAVLLIAFAWNEL